MFTRRPPFAFSRRLALGLAAAGLLAGLVLPAAATDDGPPPEQQADWQQRLNRARELQRDGQARQQAAEKLLAERRAECFDKFLVSACQTEARQSYADSVRAARQTEMEGRALEREVKREQLAERDRRQAAQRAEQEATLAGRAGKAGAARQAATLRVETRQAAKVRRDEAAAERAAAREASAKR